MNAFVRTFGLPMVVCLLSLRAFGADSAAAPADVPEANPVTQNEAPAAEPAPSTETPPAPEAAPANEPPPPPETPSPADAAPAKEASPAVPPAPAPDTAAATNNKAAPPAKPAAKRAPVPKPAADAQAGAGEDGLRFNFNDAPLDNVLDYLSEAAGFIIIRDVKVDARVDIVSHQPLTKDEAIDLLNTVLNEKGYAAVRSGRTLTIYKREDAPKHLIPVETGAIPEAIPKKDQMVTQIIPVKHADATQLLENLTPLLPAYAIPSANKSSNAIILTDTQADVRRMAEIIRALDTSISAISEVKVFKLTYSKAADTAKMINTLFQPQAATGGQPAPGGGNPMAQFFARMRGGGGGGGGGGQAQNANADSAAKTAASRVQAVADDRTNSVVIAAPGEMMSLIEEVIAEIDKASAPATEIRVFALKFAVADEMAQLINDSFSPPTTSAANQQPMQRFFGGGRFGGPGGASQAQTTVNDTVKAVSDYRTNSVVVTAESTVMDQIAAMVEQLDGNPARKQSVYVYKLENADVDNVAAILQNMIPQSTSSGSRPTQNTRATTNTGTTTSSAQRSTLGAGGGGTRGLGGF